MGWRLFAPHVFTLPGQQQQAVLNIACRLTVSVGASSFSIQAPAGVQPGIWHLLRAVRVDRDVPDQASTFPAGRLAHRTTFLMVNEVRARQL